MAADLKEEFGIELIKRLVLPMVEARSREPGDAWHQAADAILDLYRERDEAAATIAALRKRVEELEGAATTHQRTLEALREAEKALEYARPLVVSYGHTQGDRADYHAELVAPLDAALARIKEATDGR